MSSVFKLSIKGIRSFDPIDTETIEFNKPLTLIVGSNGSGKTSIIECLKFATTGDLPPNSKGGAFIHDPNIGGEKSVVAQVKLAFNNINNKNMILTKTLQVINKKASNTFKTLENQLVVLNNGERVTISTKAADIEQLVPQYLGVTKAILNYVIFCHQEDSLWPISEPSILKKRFDEIFDSVKFIKVLENFKELRKQFNEDIRLLTNNVEHLKQDRRRAQNKQAEKDDLTRTIQRYEVEVNETKDKLDQVTSRLDELFKTNQDYEAVINKIESLQQQNMSLKKQISKLKDQMEFLTDTDNELQNKLTNFNLDQEKQKHTIVELKSEVDRANASLDLKRREHNDSIRIEGELKSLRTINEKNLVERQTLMEANSLGLIISEAQTVESIKEYKSALESAAGASESKLESILQENNTMRKTLEDSLTRLRDSRMKEQQNQQYYSQDIESHKQTSRSIESRLRSIKVYEGELELEKEDLAVQKAKLQEHKKDNKLVTISGEIGEVNKQISVLESEIEESNRQISNSNKQSETVTRVNFTKEAIDRTTRSLNLLVEDNLQTFQALTGKNLEISSCISVLNESLYSKRTELDTILADHDTLQHEEFEKSSELKTLESEIKEAQAELEEKLSKVNSALPEDVTLAQYESYLEGLENDYKILSENISMMEVTVRFNEGAINTAQNEKRCLLCRKSFDDHELNGFMKLLQEHTEKLKSGSDINERNAMKEELEELKSMHGEVSRIRVLESTEIGRLNKDLQPHKDELQKVQEKMEQSQKAIATLKHEISGLEALIDVAKEISRLEAERKSSKKILESLESELFGIEVKSISSLQEEQEKINIDLKKARRRLAELLDQKDDITTEVNRLELKIKEKGLRISELEKGAIDQNNLRKQQEEIQKKIVTLLDTAKVSEKQIESLDKEYNETRRSTDEIYKSLKSKEDQISAEVHSYSILKERFAELSKLIDHYESHDHARLQKCTESISRLESEISELERELKVRLDEIMKLERELLDSNKVLRNIRDNIDFRTLEKELDLNHATIEELETQNAKITRENYKRETNELNQEFSVLKSEHAMKQGEIFQLEKQVQSIERELQKDYKNIEKKYNEEFLKLQTKFFVNNDLSVYSKALDSAVMKFHSLKMKEINEIIDALWRTTYSGSDVDTVMIKSESNTTGVKSGNRNYNYRVVMVKQGVELDMRGRCSAGQKVLASIIIRLALAECFGINFGMITLDEPTTNLDEDNIESLAKSLNQIIEMRQKQKNFQLIVITHDEKFLKHMGAARFTDLYYRVSRDERQTSVIEGVPITVIND